jgi:plastocyanin
MHKAFFPALFLRTLLASLLLPVAIIGESTGRAANSTVQIREVSASAWLFQPSNSLVNAGDSITWTNVSSHQHDSTATVLPRLWASPLLNPSNTFSFTFTNTGTFHYFCKLHNTPGGPAPFHPEQNGNVIVSAANSPPSVSLTNPPPNKRFFAPATITLQTTASDSDGSVANVQFFAGTNLLGADASSPYSLTASNLPQGTYQLTAQAVDNAGARSTSSPPVTIFVDAPPVVFLENFQFVKGNTFEFRIRGGSAGQQCDIQASSALSGDWSSIATTNFPNTFCPLCPLIDFVDPNAPPDRRFYKVIVSP